MASIIELKLKALRGNFESENIKNALKVFSERRAEENTVHSLSFHRNGEIMVIMIYCVIIKIIQSVPLCLEITNDN